MTNFVQDTFNFVTYW